MDIKPNDLINTWDFMANSMTRKSKLILSFPITIFITLLVAALIFKALGLPLLIDDQDVGNWVCVLLLCSFVLLVLTYSFVKWFDSKEKNKINNRLKIEIENGSKRLMQNFRPGEFSSKRQFEMQIWPIVIKAQDNNYKIPLPEYGMFLAGIHMSNLSDYYKKEDMEQVSKSFWRNI